MCQNEKFPVFRRRLNELLVDSNKTIVAFAEFIGTSRQSLGYYLNGQRLPDASMVEQICSRCEVSADWLLGLNDAKHIDADLKAATKCTKLSEKTILSFSKIDRDMLQLILTNDILCSLFNQMLSDIHEAHLEIRAKDEIQKLDDPKLLFVGDSILQNAEYRILHAGKCAEKMAEWASNYSHHIPIIKHEYTGDDEEGEE